MIDATPDLKAHNAALADDPARPGPSARPRATRSAFADNTAGRGGRQGHVRMADGTVYKYFHLSAIPEGIARDMQSRKARL